MSSPTYESKVKRGSSILIVADSPSRKELETGLPFTDAWATYLNRILESVGISMHKCSLATVLDFYPASGRPANIFKETKKEQSAPSVVFRNGAHVHERADRCVTSLLSFIDNLRPDKILCLGEVSTWAVLDRRSISATRGSQELLVRPYGQIAVLPTYHPNAVMRRYELHSPWLRDLQRFAETPAERFAMPAFRIRIEPTFGACISYLEGLIEQLESGSLPLSVDVETRSGWITVLGFATSPRDAFVIPFTSVSKNSYFTREEEFTLVKLCKRVLEHRNVQCIGQNFQYDVQYLVKLYGINPKIHIDTMIEAHALWTKGLQLDLAFISSLYCDWYKYWKADGKDFHKSFQTEEDQNTYWMYNGYDCCYAFECAEKLTAQWKSRPNKEVIEFQRRMQNHLLLPVLRGVRWNDDKRIAFKLELESVKAQYELWFEAMIPNDSITFGGKSQWWNSPLRLAHLLYQQLGIQPVIDKKTKRPTTSNQSNALAIIGKREPLLKRVMDVLDDYRSINQFLSLYLQDNKSSDGYMRTSYSLAGTDTFRLASRKDAFGLGLNFQNLTKG